MIQIVPVEKLQALAGPASEPKPMRSGNGSSAGYTSRLDVPAWLTARGVMFKTKGRPDALGRAVYLLEQCPFDGSHGPGNEVAIYQGADGKLGASCKHSSCAGRGWQAFKEAIGAPEPHHWDPPLSRNGKATAITALEPGTRVRAGDRGNLGEIVADHGRTCTVHFVSPDGHHAEKELPKSQLRPEDGMGGEEATVDFKIITAAELLKKDCRVEFLIPNVLAKGQHHILGGPLKCCKSLISTDLAVSLAMGGKFLDHFEASRQVRTMLLCGESGWPVLQENIRRISQARGATEANLENLLTGIILPKFGNVSHKDALCQFITEQKAEAVIIDCAYRCIPGDSASNQLLMGEVLDSIGAALDAVGATLILLCHTPKHVPAGEPLELDNLAFAGFSEFAAQWFIVNRIRPYEPGSGRHALWGVIGGRAGHSGLYAIDIDEGHFRQGEDREWRVEVKRNDEARQEERGRREQEKAKRRTEKVEDIKKRIVAAAAKFREGETPTAIRDRAGLHDRDFKPALAELLDGGELLPIEIIKANRKTPYQGYILASYQTT